MADDIKMTVLSAATEAWFVSAPERATVGLVRALNEELQEVIVAANQIVPVKTGNLKASGQVAPPEIGAGYFRMQAGYGGAASAYAQYVEAMPYDLKAPTKEGTHGQFLTTAWNDRVDGMSERIEAKMEAWFAE